MTVESRSSRLEHPGKTLTDHDCVIACVERGGKYVFVTGGKIYNISNQDMPELKEHAAHSVKLTAR